MKTYLITGATGYIGSMLVKHIKGQGARVIAIVRDRKKAECLLPEGISIIEADLAEWEVTKKLKFSCDYIIHCASITQSSQMISHPVEVTASIINTTQNMLTFARNNQIKSMVYLSSMEVYGSINRSDKQRITEEEASQGTVEPLAVRSCYPLGKRMAENLCYSYAQEYGVPVKIARLAQTFGSGVFPGDHRVFVQFANALIEEKDIVLHTKGNSMGNYCGIHDALSGILTVLEHGKNGEAYNVVNEENTMTIRQMAELVAGKLAGGKIRVVYDIPKDNLYGYAADTGLRLSGKKLEALGWKPSERLESMYADMIASIQASKKSSCFFIQ